MTGDTELADRFAIHDLTMQYPRPTAILTGVFPASKQVQSDRERRDYRLGPGSRDRSLDWLFGWASSR